MKIFINHIKNAIISFFKGDDEIHQEIYHERNIRTEKGEVKRLPDNQFIWVKIKDES